MKCRHSSSSSSSLTFNVTRTQSIKDHTLMTALRQCWTVTSCQTTLLILIMGIILDQSKTFHVNLHTLLPRLSTYPLTLVPLTCNSLHVEGTKSKGTGTPLLLLYLNKQSLITLTMSRVYEIDNRKIILRR